MELTPAQQSAFSKAAFLCSRSEKCTSEIREKLRQWELSDDQLVPVLKKLLDEKYIDEERFARAYAKDKFRFNRWGRQKIEYMLCSKQIPHEIIELAMEELNEDSYAEKLRQLLSEKAKSIKGKDQFDRRNKLVRFAMSRGFEMNSIYNALKELGI